MTERIKENKAKRLEQLKKWAVGYWIRVAVQ